MRHSLNNLRERAREKNIPYASSLKRRELESFLSNKPWSLGWRLRLIKAQCKDSIRDVQAAVKMLTSSRRDLAHFDKVHQFLEKHAVFVTLTTSPQRLKRLGAVLSTLDVEHLDGIFVVLPHRYGSNKESYSAKDISSIQKLTPLIHIIRTKTDYGPITKMLPVLKHVADPKAIVISIDDDVAYPFGMINEMIYQKVMHYPNSVIEGGTPFFARGDLRNFRILWPENPKPRLPHTDLVEGWMSVAYNSKLVDTKTMEQLASLSKNCFLSDDLVISFVLAKRNIRRVGIDNDFLFHPHPYKYGTGADALHRGKGAGIGLQAHANSDDYNFQKYRKCLLDICNAGLGPPSCST